VQVGVDCALALQGGKTAGSGKGASGRRGWPESITGSSSRTGGAEAPGISTTGRLKSPDSSEGAVVAIDFTGAAFWLLNIGKKPPHPVSVVRTTSKNTLFVEFHIASSDSSSCILESL
jgi:hypothetical protein